MRLFSYAETFFTFPKHRGWILNHLKQYADKPIVMHKKSWANIVEFSKATWWQETLHFPLYVRVFSRHGDFPEQFWMASECEINVQPAPIGVPLVVNDDTRDGILERLESFMQFTRHGHTSHQTLNQICMFTKPDEIKIMTRHIDLPIRSLTFTSEDEAIVEGVGKLVRHTPTSR